MMSSSDEDCTLISNVEVIRILQSRLKKRKKSGSKKMFQHRDWVESEVANYLKSTPCSKLDGTKYDDLKRMLQSQKKHMFSVDSHKSTGFGLTESEAVQILNFMPTEPVEIHLLIEDLHSRMPEKQQSELLEAISTYRKRGSTEETDDRQDAD